RAIAVALNVLVIEAMRNGIRGPGTSPRSRSATPSPNTQASSVPTTAAATMPGAVLARTLAMTAPSNPAVSASSHASISDPLQVRDRLLQAVLQVGPGLPGDRGRRGRDVERDPSQLSGRQRSVGRFAG